ncbi:flagellar motor protein MotB [Roseiterribacter gracilis]|uniref:Chemotaxis protein MotB n=1 Tax=Roseiterribacter gracilis TaxID=2812848 RepID=A0A8S8X9V2_9PROT|nr:chemotaxis protein MotB [Rhodospirillales bacterium TMPK1]
MAPRLDRTNQPIIIVKRRRKGNHAGHHGGAWKVAYADFVTAMMAFFLLLWLLNVTTSSQKQVIANYFDPTSVSMATSGSGGVLGGQSILEPGAQISNTRPMGTAVPLPGHPLTVKEENDVPSEEPNVDKAQFEKFEAAKKEAEKEDRKFKEAEAAIKQAIQSVPDLKEMQQNLIVDQTPEGLRIQIVDAAGKAMFPGGSSEPYDYTRKLLQQVQNVVDKLPNKLSIRGHTDATPFRSAGGYNNWDLSTDRANASRRALEYAGLDPNRVIDVSGRADKDPLFPDRPRAAENRRISIIMLREAPAPGAVAPAAASGAAAAIPPAPVPVPGVPANKQPILVPAPQR